MTGLAENWKLRPASHGSVRVLISGAGARGWSIHGAEGAPPPLTPTHPPTGHSETPFDRPDPPAPPYRRWDRSGASWGAVPPASARAQAQESLRSLHESRWGCARLSWPATHGHNPNAYEPRPDGASRRGRSGADGHACARDREAHRVLSRQHPDALAAHGRRPRRVRWHVGLQPLRHVVTVTASATHGYSLCDTCLQPLRHTVTATYGYGRRPHRGRFRPDRSRPPLIL